MSSSSNQAPGGDPRLGFRGAVPGDDAGLRRILRQSAFGTRVVFTLEREPSFFDAEGILGESTRTGVLTTDRSGPPLGLVSRSAVWVYLGGNMRRVGFVHTARLPQKGTLAATTAFLRSVRDPDDAPFDILPILEDEAGLRDALLKPVRGRPPVRLAGSVTVFLISVRAVDLRHVSPATGVASNALVPRILACLERNGRRVALAQVWRTLDFEGPVRRRGLELSDLRLHVEEGEVRGCIGIWDQTSFKQAVVRAYPRSGSIWTLIGKRSDSRRRYFLPAEGSPLRYATISHLAVDGDSPGIFRSLVAAATVEARRRRLDHIALVLGKGDPLADVLRDFVPAWELPVDLLAILWGGAEAELSAMEAGPLRPGSALL